MSKSEDIIVEISQGKLKGLKEKTVFGDTYYSFQGIPYAKPPLGDLRFKNPEPAEGWEGVRDATKTGGMAPSLDETGSYSKESNEDCLYIHVYIKELPQGPTKYPVMVWIHGGGFTGGTGNKDWYGPDILLHGNIIMVSLNYRVGALGFLSLKSTDCPGNYGLKDQRLALQWVQQNISSFGGDPENVTIFGESAGSASVLYQVVSPSTNGLFKKAIAQSGTCNNRWAYSNYPREVAFLLGKKLGLETADDDELLSFLKKASPEDIVLNSVTLMSEIQGDTPGESRVNYSFLPTAEPERDGIFINEHPSISVANGRFKDIPIIIGTCSREMMGIGVANPNDFPTWTKDEEFQGLIPRDIHVEKDSELSLEISKRIRQFYFKNGVDLLGYIDVLTDNYFNYGVYKFFKSHAANKKSPIHLYVFNYIGSRNWLKNSLGFADTPGCSHGDDIGYLFNFSRYLPPLETGTADSDFALKFLKLWTDFAETGSPASPEEWPSLSKESIKHLSLNKEFQVVDDYFKERMQFWDDIYDLVTK